MVSAAEKGKEWRLSLELLQEAPKKKKCLFLVVSLLVVFETVLGILFHVVYVFCLLRPV